MLELMDKSIMTESPSRIRDVIRATDGSHASYSEYGPYSNVYDSNTSNYYGAYWKYYGDNIETQLKIYGTSTWDTPMDISEVSVKAYISSATTGDCYNGGHIQFYVYLKINGSWQQIEYNGYTWTCHDCTRTRNHEWTGTSGWSNVTGIKYYLRAHNMADSGGYSKRYVTHNCRIYTMSVKNSWNDSGIRVYDGENVVKIAKEPFAGHKLRCYKGSSVYGIPLQPTNGGLASPIRIYDGSTVKALPEYPV